MYVLCVFIVFANVPAIILRLGCHFFCNRNSIEHYLMRSRNRNTGSSSAPNSWQRPRTRRRKQRASGVSDTEHAYLIPAVNRAGKTVCHRLSELLTGKLTCYLHLYFCLFIIQLMHRKFPNVSRSGSGRENRKEWLEGGSTLNQSVSEWSKKCKTLLSNTLANKTSCYKVLFSKCVNTKSWEV